MQRRARFDRFLLAVVALLLGLSTGGASATIGDDADRACREWAADEVGGNVPQHTAYELGCRLDSGGVWFLPHSPLEPRLTGAIIGPWEEDPACGMMPVIVCAPNYERTRAFGQQLIIDLSLFVESLPPDLLTSLSGMVDGHVDRTRNGGAPRDIQRAYNRALILFIERADHVRLRTYVAFWKDYRKSVQTCPIVTTGSCSSYYGPVRQPWPWDLVDPRNLALFIQAVVDSCTTADQSVPACQSF